MKETFKMIDGQEYVNVAGFPMAGKLEAQNIEGVDTLRLKKPETDTKDG